MTRTIAVEYEDAHGTFRSEGWDETAARRLVADAAARAPRKVTAKSDPRFVPRPVRVLVRECDCPWRDVTEGAA